MMKKRILASSMASVMALSSISVVAFADEKDYGEAVSKADLEAFLKAEVDFVENKLGDYGTVQADKYQAAIDHCTRVVEDTKSEAKDYSAAYQMAKAVKAKLVIYTADQLKALIKENQSKYDSNNIMNEELQDLIYDEEDYQVFVDAFTNAENYVDSDDSRVITDAYIDLEDAVKNLTELTFVAKSDFRAALKAYEAVRYEMKNYESWRRGSFTVVATETTNKDAWKKLLNAEVELADVEDILFGASDGGAYKYWGGTSWKSDAVLKANEQWIGDADFTFSGSIYDSINSEYSRFDDVKAAVKTTDKQIVSACQAALDAVKVFEGWEVDNKKSGSKAGCASLLKKYNAKLVAEYDSTISKDAVFAAIDGLTGVTVTSDMEKAVMKADKKIAIIKDKNTGCLADLSYIYANGTAAQEALEALDEATAKNLVVQNIAANANILNYLEVDLDSVDHDAANGKDGSGALLADAILIYQDFEALYADSKITDDEKATAQAYMDVLADGKTIVANGKSGAEWTIVWRLLSYALEDSFPETKETTYTLKQLKDMIDRAYDIAEKTGDSAVFAGVHQDVVDERQYAIEFYTAAKAITGYKTDMIVLGTDLATVYKALKTDVENLEGWYKDYLYSYEEIRTLIGETAIKVDNGDIKADAVKKALAQCAYDLAVLEAEELKSGEENEAFDDERKYQSVNRLHTAKNKCGVSVNDFEKALLKSYEALVKAVDEAKGGATTGVKNDFDGDGKFGASDLTAILEAYTASSTDKKYDANGDGSFGVADLTFVLEAFTAQA